MLPLASAVELFVQFFILAFSEPCRLEKVYPTRQYSTEHMRPFPPEHSILGSPFPRCHLPEFAAFLTYPSFIFCRGKFRSKPWDSILEEAHYLVSEGALELNLIAEDTNQWGQDRRDGKNLAHLLRALSEIEGLHWIRILYAYPSYFNEELIDEIASNPKVMTKG